MCTDIDKCFPQLNILVHVVATNIWVIFDDTNDQCVIFGINYDFCLSKQKIHDLTLLCSVCPCPTKPYGHLQ